MLRSLFSATLAILATTLLTSVAAAQTATVTFDLNNVLLTNDITSPWPTTQSLSGTFQWTYTVGDFQNGSGTFLTLDIPWSSETIATLGWTVETKSIEITLPISTHDKGVDITIKLLQDFTETSGAVIDTVLSSFEIEQGTTQKGHFLSGSIDVACAPASTYGVGSPGKGGIVPTITSVGGAPKLGNTSFAVQCDSIVGKASCFLLLGFGKIQQTAFGIDVLVNPAGMQFLPAQASGIAGLAGSGSVLIPLSIPSNPALAGLEVDLQLVAMDSAAPLGIASATQGLSATLCL